MPRVDPGGLSGVFHRRWAVPVLGELAELRGCRLIQLTTRLEAGRQPVRDAIDALIGLGLVRPNPGYGHPLRPEYLLTARGERAAPACRDLMRALERARAVPVGLRKWSMPTLAALDTGATRFGEIAGALGGATDRAVSIALGELGEAGLVSRRVIDARPPTPTYALTKRAGPIARPLAVIGAA